ncbi:MAG: c-type cytochrome [Geminocystis sp.]|nr:c-type cytochrome [Geminocystis sp.]HIK36733.1 c-type cytochrome [Geminocystis sp. M7585_C2015_104]MCS7146813.1 c-type cytochrome [Geminocystis sp.]MCX8077037.1 c-type cytochrome [Geminocystis sp.]MDW8115639.1 c-type cytochrome [Geminocystis sp.]
MENGHKKRGNHITSVIITTVVLLFQLTVISPSLAQESPTHNLGEKIFQTHCAACHPNGSNIIRRGKNLKLKALKRYGYDSPEAIIQIVTQGKNNMSAFGNRLTEDEIKAVAEYVLTQAKNNWKS